MFRIALALLLLASPLKAQEAAEPPMSMDRMAEILLALDPDAQSQVNRVFLTIEDVPVVIVADVGADRMRAMTPIRSAAELSADELQRMMQANFDTALDARYAIAQGRLWSVFIHPFAALEKDQLISAIGQVVNLALTYGSLYTGGAITYGGGDSGALQRDLIERLLKKGEPI